MPAAASAAATGAAAGAAVGGVLLQVCECTVADQILLLLPNTNTLLVPSWLLCNYVLTYAVCVQR
jgi:hypothetical protein